MEPLNVRAALDELKNLLELIENHPHDYMECNRRNRRVMELCDYLDKMDRKGESI